MFIKLLASITLENTIAICFLTFINDFNIIIYSSLLLFFTYLIYKFITKITVIYYILSCIQTIIILAWFLWLLLCICTQNTEIFFYFIGFLTCILPALPLAIIIFSLKLSQSTLTKNHNLQSVYYTFFALGINAAILFVMLHFFSPYIIFSMPLTIYCIKKLFEKQNKIYYAAIGIMIGITLAIHGMLIMKILHFVINDQIYYCIITIFAAQGAYIHVKKLPEVFKNENQELCV